MTWARKKTGQPVVRLNSVADAEAFANKYSMFVIGLFDEFEVFYVSKPSLIFNLPLRDEAQTRLAFSELIFPEYFPKFQLIGILAGFAENVLNSRLVFDCRVCIL